MLLMQWCADALMLLNQDQDLLADLSVAICSCFNFEGWLWAFFALFLYCFSWLIISAGLVENEFWARHLRFNTWQWQSSVKKSVQDNSRPVENYIPGSKAVWKYLSNNSSKGKIQQKALQFCETIFKCQQQFFFFSSFIIVMYSLHNMGSVLDSQKWMDLELCERTLAFFCALYGQQLWPGELCLCRARGNMQPCGFYSRQ